MADELEVTVDKFVFRVAADRLYSPEGLWVQAAGDQVRVGLTDFLQQRSGDVAFAELKPAGTSLKAGDELAVIETIKVDISLYAPVTGVIAAVNPALENQPELINLDPYGEGWLVLIDPANWEAEKASLRTPQVYFTLMKGQAEAEVGSA
ncbi:MAG: glycine cleavage system protein H [Anaerolineales bacterium]|jgi:glycine cleavage system H protein